MQDLPLTMASEPIRLLCPIPRAFLSDGLVAFRLRGYGKSELNVEKKRRALSEAAERRELFLDYSHLADLL